MPKFNKDDILKYYDILEVNKDEGLIIRDSINLNLISDLYELNGFNNTLSYTSEELSNVYSLLFQILKDGFWYSTKKRREEALNASFEIINELMNLDYKDEDDEELTIDRRNNLKATIIKGLCSAGDLITFRFYQNNSSFNTIYNKIKEIEKEQKANDFMGVDYDKVPDDLMKLYYLIALSKLKNNKNDYEMFDGTGQVSMINLKSLIRRNIIENVPESDSFEREKVDNPKILRLKSYKKKD